MRTLDCLAPEAGGRATGDGGEGDIISLRSSQKWEKSVTAKNFKKFLNWSYWADKAYWADRADWDRY